MSDSDKQCYFLLCGIPYNEKAVFFCLAEYPIMKKYPIFALRNFQKERSNTESTQRNIRRI